MNLKFLFLHLSSSETLPVSTSPSIPTPSPPDLSDTPPHSFARALPRSQAPCSHSHIPSGYSPGVEKPSLIPFLLPALGSDILVIPVWDGQRDNAWHRAHLSSQDSQSCFRWDSLPTQSIHPGPCPPGPSCLLFSRNKVEDPAASPKENRVTGQLPYRSAFCSLPSDVS